MNKVLKMCLLTGVALSLAACGNKDVTTGNEVMPEENKVEINQPAENPAPEVNAPVVDNETKPEEKPAEQKPEKEPAKPNKEPVQKPVEELPAEKPAEPVKPVEPAKKPETKVAMETIANKMVETTGVEFRMPFTMPIEAERSTEFIGLSQADFEKYVTDSTALESMVMPSNYSLCIIKVNDTSKIEEIKKSIFDNCDPRKWICTSAEYVTVVDCNDCVMLLMANKDASDKLMPAFASQVGGTLGKSLERAVAE